MKNILAKILLALFFAQLGEIGYASDISSTNRSETLQQHNAHMQWWRDAKFGMFIHWGLYSEFGGIYEGKHYGSGEWIMNEAKIPVNKYATYAADFNPTNFDAGAWVSLARKAGMKYIVFTAKHHDGFAMFHSEVDHFNIYDATPFHRDPVKELADACEGQGIRFGVDYSQAQDWHHAGGAISHHGAATASWDPVQVGSFDNYLKTVSIPQIRELLSNYGSISEFWFDTPAGITHEQAGLIRAALQLQPQLIVNNRLGGGDQGDFRVMERRTPGFGMGNTDFETCMNINGSWGYESFRTNFTSASSLLYTLIDIVSRGGNLLLDVGPDATGIIPEPEVVRLKIIGDWLGKNGEAIYGTSASPFTQNLSWGRCTQKDGKLYLIVMKWPDDGRLEIPIENQNVQAWLLSSPDKKLLSKTENNEVSIQVPWQQPDPIATVIVMTASEPLLTTQNTIQSSEPNRTF